MKNAILFLSLYCGLPLTADGTAPQNRALRVAATEWASSSRARVFDELMPPAAAVAVVHPTCRVTTVRSAGSADTFEFAITLRESCDGAAEASFAITAEQPLHVQLLRARMSERVVDESDATRAVRVTRRTLSPAEARRIIADLQRLRLSPLPQPGVAFDVRSYEISSNTGLETFMAEITDVASPGDRRQALEAVRNILRRLKVREADLTFFSDSPD